MRLNSRQIQALTRQCQYHTVEANSCWRWSGNIAPNGYGRFRLQARQYYAHRYYFEFYKHKLHEKLVIDHLCKNRWCVNPEHLEEVTIYTNTLRGTAYNKPTCPKGHEYTVTNTVRDYKGARRCKQCTTEYNKKV